MSEGLPLRSDVDPQETHEWMESLDDLLVASGEARTRYIVRKLIEHAQALRIGIPALVQTPYINTIPPEDEPPFPGDDPMEKRIRRLIRWNAVAMVLRANQLYDGIGGHLATMIPEAATRFSCKGTPLPESTLGRSSKGGSARRNSRTSGWSREGRGSRATRTRA
jgi:pyruvate dehydrogenase complex dehydrogenase (E1) component